MKKRPDIPRDPPVLRRVVRQQEVAGKYRAIDAARMEHLLRQHRANVHHERLRLQSIGERILPGLREHMARRNTAFAALQQRR